MFRALVVALFLTLGGGASAAPPAADCKALPGIDRTLARQGLRFLLFGEFHGTSEKPDIVADALCAAARTKRPIILALEFTRADQPALDLYMRSDGSTDARAALLAAPAWAEEGGRSSQGILKLIERARRLAKLYDVRIIAFDTAPEPGTSLRRENAMAESLRAAAAEKPRSLVVALTGSGHADKEGFTSRTPPHASAAGLLPTEATISLSFARPGGSFWGCRPADNGAAEGCKAYSMPIREPVTPRGIVLDPALRAGFDGIYSAGRQYSASAPARARS